MLLWLANLHFAGSSTTFFVSGRIPVQYEANVIVRGESDIPVQYDPPTQVGTENVVSIQ